MYQLIVETLTHNAKIQLIKVDRCISGRGLKESKDFVEKLPGTRKRNDADAYWGPVIDVPAGTKAVYHITMADFIALGDAINSSALTFELRPFRVKPTSAPVESPFYLVWRNNTTPVERHTTLESADTEAQRLANVTALGQAGEPFHVLKVVRTYVRQVNPLKRTDYR